MLRKRLPLSYNPSSVIISFKKSKWLFLKTTKRKKKFSKMPVKFLLSVQPLFAPETHSLEWQTFLQTLRLLMSFPSKTLCSVSIHRLFLVYLRYFFLINKSYSKKRVDLDLPGFKRTSHFKRLQEEWSFPFKAHHGALRTVLIPRWRATKG